MLMTEAEMREATAPTLKTPKELTAYIKSLVEQPHDYGACVYAMSLAATASFNYVAGKLGVTGFQAGCADMDILRRTRHWRGPAMVVDLSDHLFPQYDLVGRVREAIEESSDWYREEAKKLLDRDHGEFPPHPDVLAHWRKLAGLETDDCHREDGCVGEAEPPHTTVQP